MAKRPLHHLAIYALLIWAALFSVNIFTHTIHERLYDFSQSTIVDIDIYWKAAKRYNETGLLYERFHDLKQGYAPSEPVYKFPPAYQLTLLPFFNEEANTFFLLQRYLQIITYLVACLIIMFVLSKNCSSRLVFICLAVTLAMMSRHFPDTFQNTTPECYIFLLLAVTLWQMPKRPVVSGVTLALAACFKIYPVFFLLYPVITRNYRMLAGFAGGVALVTITSLVLVGYNEHIFYLQKILPILLAEKPIANSQNLTLESFALNMHLLDNMNGILSIIIKYITLAMLIVIGFRTDFKHQKQEIIYFGLLCCGVLMFLSNYWLQYQLILLIPMFYLIAECINTRHPILILIGVCCMLLFMIDSGWSELVIATMDQIPTEQEIKLFIDQNPDTDPLWHFAPLIWAIYHVVELRPLLPVLLFAGLATLHHQARAGKLC